VKNRAKTKMVRRQAAIKLNEIYNFYEVRKNSLKTTYNKIFKDRINGTWRLIGYAHDYSLPYV
jgi:hypothetical protein